MASIPEAPVFPVIGEAGSGISIVHIVFFGAHDKVVEFTHPGSTIPWLRARSGDGTFWNRIFDIQDGVSILSSPGANASTDWTPVGAKRDSIGGTVSTFSYGYTYAAFPDDLVLITIIVQPGIVPAPPAVHA